MSGGLGSRRRLSVNQYGSTYGVCVFFYFILLSWLMYLPAIPSKKLFTILSILTRHAAPQVPCLTPSYAHQADAAANSDPSETAPSTPNSFAC